MRLQTFLRTDVIQRFHVSLTKIWDYMVKLLGSVNRFKGLIRKFQEKTKRGLRPKLVLSTDCVPRD